MENPNFINIGQDEKKWCCEPIWLINSVFHLSDNYGKKCCFCENELNIDEKCAQQYITYVCAYNSKTLHAFELRFCLPKPNEKKEGNEINKRDHCHIEFHKLLLDQVLYYRVFIGSMPKKNDPRLIEFMKNGKYKYSGEICYNENCKNREYINGPKLIPCICKLAFYCDSSCQKQNWLIHKPFCMNYANTQKKIIKKQRNDIISINPCGCFNDIIKHQMNAYTNKTCSCLGCLKPIKDNIKNINTFKCMADNQQTVSSLDFYEISTDTYMHSIPTHYCSIKCKNTKTK